ncbi:MAG TPA: (d)CMP kinase [Bacteroidetes bacterium]|nr:(d)CMP kinase [Bacteroidota bacterium]
MEKITIAIDGHSSCGKSTLAKALGNALNYAYISTGDMYRAVTLYFIENKVDIKDPEAVRAALQKIKLHFELRPEGNCIFLNGRNVNHDIRTMPVNELVSPVSTISEVRKEMVRQQQEMGKNKGIVMDGRDIGTVVFPDAELKIFLTADVEERARRRYNELIAKGMKVDLDEIKHNLEERDRIDSSRKDSPLKKAADAILLDNTHLNHEQQLDKVLQMVKEKLWETRV